MNQQQAQAEELFFVVDDYDTPLAPLPRREVHGHGIWHRTTHVWLVNGASEILCHQRSFEKELSPGKWTANFGGHSAPDETYIDSAMRELYEEVGLSLPAESFHLWKIYKHHDPKNLNNEFQGIFIVRWNGSVSEVSFNDGEVEQIAWRKIANVQTLVTRREDWAGGVGYAPEFLKELRV